MCGCSGRSCKRKSKRSYLAVIMPMYSRIPAHRQTWQYSFAMLEPGDKVMGMNLDHGGHLTHGSPVNISGKYFNIVSYGVNDEGCDRL